MGQLKLEGLQGLLSLGTAEGGGDRLLLKEDGRENVTI